jgi:hypothetical protein
MSDHALDALLAEHVAPPVPMGLDARAAAAALALAQEPLLALSRRATAAPRHDRRGKWLRRPLLLTGVALGLAVSGALAASLAGVRLDRLPVVEAMLSKLPFMGREAPPPPAAPPPQLAAPAEPAPAVSQAAAPPEQEPPPRHVVAVRVDAAPAAAPALTPQRFEVAAPTPTPRPLDVRPPVFSPPPPVAPPAAPEVRPASAAVAETRAPAPGVATEARLQQERTERLRAARQAQIERLQRVQQRRERIRRLRRD